MHRYWLRALTRERVLIAEWPDAEAIAAPSRQLPNPAGRSREMVATRASGRVCAGR
jgi:hypothetical protein